MADNLMEDLAENECLELLSAHHFGRVAFVERTGAPPVIMPLNYLVHAETVVCRTDPQSKLGSALRDTPVSFEIDGIEQRQRTGWSVVVSGSRRRSWMQANWRSSIRLRSCRGHPVIVLSTSELRQS